MGDRSILGPFVDCYCQAQITLEADSIISQYSYLCAGSHDITDHFQHITAPIRIEEGAWVAADVFVGPGVTVGRNAVVGARSTVLKNVEAACIYAGSPAKFIRKRELRDYGM